MLLFERRRIRILQNKNWIFGSAFCSKNTKVSFTFLSLNDVIMSLIKTRICVAWRVHSITKCCSSSNTWHLGHNLSSSGVLGLVFLPRSTSKACELVLNFDIAAPYRGFLTMTRYDSTPKLFLNRRIGFLLISATDSCHILTKEERMTCLMWVLLRLVWFRSMPYDFASSHTLPYHVTNPNECKRLCSWKAMLTSEVFSELLFSCHTLLIQGINSKRVASIFYIALGWHKIIATCKSKTYLIKAIFVKNWMRIISALIFVDLAIKLNNETMKILS